MFLNAVVLILQEILEASLLLSVLVVLQRLRWPRADSTSLLQRQWILFSLFSGFLGAFFYARNLALVSTWFDYVGLEVVNALIQLAIISCVLLLCYWRGQAGFSPLRAACMIGLVALGITREVSEIILYTSGIMMQPGNMMPVMLGGLTGAGIGISCGVFLMYTLLLLPRVAALRTAMVLLGFFAGNMASQAVVLLIQADWIPVTPQLWDSAAFLPEYSITGQLLYALTGYDANPYLFQVLCYVAAFILVVLSPLCRQSWRKAPDA